MVAQRTLSLIYEAFGDVEILLVLTLFGGNLCKHLERMGRLAVWIDSTGTELPKF